MGEPRTLTCMRREGLLKLTHSPQTFLQSKENFAIILVGLQLPELGPR